MSACGCPEVAHPFEAPHCRPPSHWRKGGEAVGWVVPAATLLLMPKCPMCFAGYVALATGIGVTLPTAMWLRAMLVFDCVALLALLAGRRLWKALDPQ